MHMESKYFQVWDLHQQNCYCKILLHTLLCVQPNDCYIISQNLWRMYVVLDGFYVGFYLNILMFVWKLSSIEMTQNVLHFNFFFFFVKWILISS